MDNITKSQIISLIHQEVIPAIGCTEPVAVALAAAKAAEVLGERPEWEWGYPEQEWWDCLSRSLSEH